MQLPWHRPAGLVSCRQQLCPERMHTATCLTATCLTEAINLLISPGFFCAVQDLHQRGAKARGWEDVVRLCVRQGHCQNSQSQCCYIIRRIYIDELHRPALGEAYCDRVYTKAIAAKQQSAGGGGAAALPLGGAEAKPPGSIYLQLIQVELLPVYQSVGRLGIGMLESLNATLAGSTHMHMRMHKHKGTDRDDIQDGHGGAGSARYFHGIASIAAESPFEPNEIFGLQTFLSPSLAAHGKGPDALSERRVYTF